MDRLHPPPAPEHPILPFSDPLSLEAKDQHDRREADVTARENALSSVELLTSPAKGASVDLPSALIAVDEPIRSHHEDGSNWSWIPPEPLSDQLVVAPDSSVPELSPEDTTPREFRTNRLDDESMSSRNEEGTSKGSDGAAAGGDVGGWTQIYEEVDGTADLI